MFNDKFRKAFASKVFYIIFSILAACALWFFLAINKNQETTDYFGGIQIEFSGQDTLEDRDLIVTDIDVDKLALRLSGKRLDIAKINNEDIIATVDMSGITTAGTHLLQYSIDYNANINENNISIVSASTNYVTVTVEKLVTTPVNVRASFDGNIDDGYIGGTLICTPGSIEISGPEDEIALVAYARAVLSRDSISKTTSENVPFTLMDKDGNPIVSENITANVETVEVTQEVSTVKDVPLAVNVVYDASATEQNTVIDIEPSVITLSGDAEAMDSINKITLGTIDLSSFQTSYSEEMRIVIPDDTTNNSGVTTATVTVRVIGLEVTKLSATNIEVVNAPEGCTTSIITQSVDVTLRGSADNIANVKPENIRVVANLENVGSTGIFDVEARVYVDGYPSIGAIGTYKINVRIKKN